MKAKTAAQKLKAKRGRPPTKNVEREPSGRVSRSREAPNKLALEVRARMLKITVEDAKNQQAGTFLGRLHMAYEEWRKSEKSNPRGRPQPAESLSTAQYHALLTAEEAHNDFLKAVGAPGARYEMHFGSSGDEDGHARWCNAAKIRWHGKDMRGGIVGAIHEAQAQERQQNLWAALDLCVFQGQWLTHMIPTLRTLGNALARHHTRG